MSARKIDITGCRFGKLTAIRPDHKGKYAIMWFCVCDCGKTKTVAINSLRAGNTMSCGCLVKEVAKVGKDHRAYKHGMCTTRFYHIWQGVLKRGTGKETKRSYAHVKICDKWLSFISFRDDMYDSYILHVKNYGERNTTIDRVDSKGGYNPENCRWATYKVQGNNTENVITIEYNGVIHPLLYWAEKLNIKRGTLYYRVCRLGWSIEDSLFKKVSRKQ